MSELVVLDELRELGSPKIQYKSKPELGVNSYINASDDLTAVSRWLEQYSYSENTYKYYKKESKRLLTWCSYESGKYFKQLKPDDMLSYFDFLKNPPSRWVTTKSEIRKGSHLPFCDGGLKESSFNASIRAVNSLFNYLVSAQYLSFNPLKLVRSHKSFSLDANSRKYQVKSRMLNDQEWQTLISVLNDSPDSTLKEEVIKKRKFLIIGMMYFLGIRINELATHTWSSFREDDDKWWFYVKGKGGKEGSIPVPSQLMDIVISYRKVVGKSDFPLADELEYLVSKNTKPLSSRTIHKIIKDLALSASERFEEGSPSQQKLKLFSPHWLRHLSASHQDKLGIPATMIRDNHRHSSFQTTQIYLHSEDDARHNYMQKMSMPGHKTKLEPKVHLKTLTISVKNVIGNDSQIKKYVYIAEKILNKKLIKMTKCLDNTLNYEKQYRVLNLLDKELEELKKEAECRLLKVDINYS